jgi:hypothetical protein
MASITRRFLYKGPWPKAIRELTEVGVTFPFPVPAFIVTYDVAFNDVLIDQGSVDEAMKRYGCFPDTQNTRALSPNPFLGLQSPDGSAWKLQVDDLGVLTVVKVS